jgi:hypothetical protein
MSILDLIVLSAAIPTVLAYVCRLNMLRIGSHRASAILLHAGPAVSSIWAGYDAWNGHVSPGDIAALLSAIVWIFVSYSTWKDGVPEHFSKNMRRMFS